MDESMDRRAFLTSAPRRLLANARNLMKIVTATTEGDRRLAVLDVARCLAWGAGPPLASLAEGGECQLCYLRCPLRDGAITLECGRPTIVASVCDGCGICVDVCRTVNDLGAIQIVSASSKRFLEHDVDHSGRTGSPLHLK